MGVIAFAACGVPHIYREKPRLKRWLFDVAEEHGAPIEALSFVLVSDDALRGYNERFLGKTYFTDVIAFDNQGGNGISGDVLISYHRTKENALLYSASHQAEVRRVMLHGLLHLLGHRDDSPRLKSTMRSVEDFYLRRY
jgi:probable rRNA maturation factor